MMGWGCCSRETTCVARRRGIWGVVILLLVATCIEQVYVLKIIFVVELQANNISWFWFPCQGMPLFGLFPCGRRWVWWNLAQFMQRRNVHGRSICYYHVASFMGWNWTALGSILSRYRTESLLRMHCRWDATSGKNMHTLLGPCYCHMPCMWPF